MSGGVNTLSERGKLSTERHETREGWLQNFGVATERSEGQGQYVVATREFEEGEVLLSTEPYAFVLFGAHGAERCHECFEASSKLSRCAACKLARYCSTACQHRAWNTHHKFECVIQEELEHLCGKLPAVAQEELALLVRAAIKHMAQTPSLAQSSRPYVADYDDVLAMTSHKTAVDPERANGNRYIARMALSILKLPRLCKKKGLERGRMPSQEELESLLCAFACNDFAIWDELLVSRGAGIYPLGALLNHSCEPNIVIYYEPHTHRQIMRCIRRIRTGEQACHAYVDIAATSPTRRQKLENIYNFTCKCARCSQASDVLDDKLEPRAGFREAEAAEALESHAAHALDDMEGCVSRCIAALESAQSVEAVAAACKELAMAEARLRPRRDDADLLLLRLRSSLLQGWIEAGNGTEAIETCSGILNAYKLIYPPKHPLIGLQLYTLGNLQVECGACEQGLESLQGAKAILLVTHGRESKMVKGLQELIEVWSKGGGSPIK